MTSVVEKANLVESETVDLATSNLINVFLIDPEREFIMPPRVRSLQPNLG